MLHLWMCLCVSVFFLLLLLVEVVLVETVVVFPMLALLTGLF